MCAGVLQDLNSLKDYNIILSKTITIEGMEGYTEEELKALRKDRGFWQILDGSKLHCHLTIRCQVDDESGRLIYNGRPYSRSSWSWRPAKVIRQMGRIAKEVPDPRNTHPEISIYTERGKLLRLDACPCGGDLILDHNYNLYCEKCNLIYE